MKMPFLLLLILGVTLSCKAQEDDAPASDINVHHFTMTTIDGEEQPLNHYEGEVLLLVNVASKCGYTPQYTGLQELFTRYAERGFRVLAFPANNFGAQEPGSNEEIKEFCSTTYNVTFDMFSKISVKGDDMHPLYRWLTKESGFNGDIKWNFTKFLVDRDGNVVARFETRVNPLDDAVTGKIEELLAQ
jgi:glutathione peroxidase